MGAIYDVRGTQLYVDDLGEKTNPAILYVHGGPGTGSYDFIRHQGQLLSKYLRVIAFDQRGVLRSADLEESEEFGLADLVEDCEALRQALGVPRWTVLSHSFGGYVGLLYAKTYPASVSRLIFENPAFDLGLSARSLLKGAAVEYGAMGRTEQAAKCLQVAFAPPDVEPASIWRDFTDLTNGLDNRRNNLYVSGCDTNFFEQLVKESDIAQENWGKAGRHQNRLYQEGDVFRSLIPTISTVYQPTLLIKGKFDYVFSLDQLHAFMTQKPDSELSVFQESSHFPHVEEAEKFATAVMQFARQDQVQE